MRTSHMPLREALQRELLEDPQSQSSVVVVVVVVVVVWNNQICCFRPTKANSVPSAEDVMEVHEQYIGQWSLSMLVSLVHEAPESDKIQMLE